MEHRNNFYFLPLAIEGFGGVPPIRPLETLHNALSLRQLDSFLEMMTIAPLYRTPASSPPKSSPAGSTHESLNPPLGNTGIIREYHSSDTEAVRYHKKLQAYKYIYRLSSFSHDSSFTSHCILNKIISLNLFCISRFMCTRK